MKRETGAEGRIKGERWRERGIRETEGNMNKNLKLNMNMNLNTNINMEIKCRKSIDKFVSPWSRRFRNFLTPKMLEFRGICQIP